MWGIILTGMLYPYLDHRPQVHASCFIAPTADLIGQVVIHKDASVWFNCTLRGDINSIEVGEGTNIQDNSVIHVADNYSTEIESFVTIGHRCTIHSCKIEEGALVGIGAIILDGAVIGHHSLVGAGSLVPKGATVPPRSLLLGSPARVIRTLTESEVNSNLQLAQKYVRIKDNYSH